MFYYLKNPVLFSIDISFEMNVCWSQTHLAPLLSTTNYVPTIICYLLS